MKKQGPSCIARLMRYAAFALALTMLGGCGTKNNGKESAPEVDWTALEALEFSHRGMNKDSIYTYRAQKMEEHVSVYTSTNSGDFKTDEIMGEPDFETLTALAQKYALQTWNGFDKANTLVLDGTGFTLFIKLSGGQTIEAKGENTFPEGYVDFLNELNALFAPYTDIEAGN